VELEVGQTVDITTPNYPLLYPPNACYEWVLTAPDGQRANIVFNAFIVCLSNGFGTL